MKNAIQMLVVLAAAAQAGLTPRQAEMVRRLERMQAEDRAAAAVPVGTPATNSVGTVTTRNADGSTTVRCRVEGAPGPVETTFRTSSTLRSRRPNAVTR